MSLANVRPFDCTEECTKKFKKPTKGYCVDEKDDPKMKDYCGKGLHSARCVCEVQP